MSLSRFRRRKRRSWILCGLFAVLLGLRYRVELTKRGPIDPATVSILSGEYSVRRIRGDGMLEVNVAADRRNSNPWAVVRLLGIEMVDDRAVHLLRHWTGDGRVRLRFDRRRLDDDGTLQAYVYVGEQLLNVELVRAGVARQQMHPADSGPIVRQMKRAQDEARQHARGIWAPEFE